MTEAVLKHKISSVLIREFPDKEVAESVLDEIIGMVKLSSVGGSNGARVRQAVAEHYGITVEELIGASRMHPLIDARSICYHAMRYKCNMRPKAIKGLMKRGNAAIICGLNHFRDMIDTEHDFRVEYGTIELQLDKIITHQ